MKLHLLRFGTFTLAGVLACGFYELLESLYIHDYRGFWMLVGSLGFGLITTLGYYLYERS